MRAKDKFLKKANWIFLISILLISKNLFAKNTEPYDLFNYNNSLANSTALFIQSDGETIEEGIIYIGSERVRVDYEKPKKITIVLSKDKGMYINHALEETQYFSTKTTFVNIIFSILSGGDFYETDDINIFKDSIVIKKEIELDDVFYRVEVIYENDPIKIRKVKIVDEVSVLELGFFNHNNLINYEKEFFSFINPYLN
tara:strand:+ start:2051 stop:2647 length:597 start_codon:yes stop_codon:yes gene_type:complete